MTLLGFVGHLTQKHQNLHCPLPQYHLVYPAFRLAGVVVDVGYKVGDEFRGSVKRIQLPLVCWQRWKGCASDRFISQLFSVTVIT